MSCNSCGKKRTVRKAAPKTSTKIKVTIKK